MLNQEVINKIKQTITQKPEAEQNNLYKKSGEIECCGWVVALLISED